VDEISALFQEVHVLSAINIKLQKIQTLRLAVTLTAVSLTGAVIVVALIYLLIPMPAAAHTPPDFLGALYIFSLLILAPVIETPILVATFIIFEFLYGLIWKTRAAEMAIVSAALVFAACHAPYRLVLAIGVFWPGLVFAYAYVLMRTKTGVFKSVAFSSGVHCLHNAAVFLLIMFGLAIDWIFNAA
jgi:hypothetical protein